MQTSKSVRAYQLAVILFIGVVASFSVGLLIPANTNAQARGNATSTTQFSQNRSLWQKGDDVRSLQRFLNAAGFLVALSGAGSPGNETLLFGLRTYHALTKFQAAHGLPATGYFGSLTRALLNSEATLQLANSLPIDTHAAATPPTSSSVSTSTANSSSTIPSIVLVSPGYGGGGGGSSSSQSSTPADTIAPSVLITVPSNGAIVSGNSVTLSATASDDVAIAGVTFKINGVIIGSEATSSPYSVIWNSTATSSGSKAIIAVARDTSGNLATSTAVTVTADNTPPSVSLTVPLSGATIYGASVTLTATASDNVGVANVQFSVDGTNVGTVVTSGPYTTTWDSTGVSDGPHTLYAVAKDTSGNYATSSKNITTNNTSWYPAGASAAINFLTGQYAGSCSSIASCLSTTRASSGTDLLYTSPPGYVYNTFASGVLRITPGLGLLSEDTHTNYLLNSGSPATQTTATLSNGSYTLWGNFGIGGSASMSSGTATGCGTGTATQGVPLTFTISSPGTCVVTVNGLANEFQINNQALPLSYCPTTSTTSQCLADNNFATGPLATLLLASQGSVYVNTGYPPLASGGRRVIGSPGFKTLVSISLTAQASMYNGSVGLAANAGFGGWTSGSPKLAAGWSSGGRSLVFNQGTVATDTDSNQLQTTAYLGGDGGTSASQDAYTGILAVFNTRLSDSALSNLTTVPPFMVGWGDSITQGAGASIQPQNTWLYELSQALNRTAVNNGIGGQSSTQIAARVSADAGAFAANTIQSLEGGYIDSNSTTTVIANFATMVAAVPGNNHYVVISVPNGSNEPSGSVGYNNITAINSALAASYPSNYVDVRSYLINSGLAAVGLTPTAQDLIDISNDVIPTSLRADAVHWNDYGHQAAEIVLLAFINANGW